MSGPALKPLLATLRPPFLVLTPVCVGLGYAVARLTGAEPRLFDVGLFLLGALSAHVSVNTFNEYYDFRSGLDLHTTRTPFSGGSGALPANPALAGWTLSVAVTSLLVTVIIGGYFLLRVDWHIMPIGVLGILTVLAYTRWITRHPLLCLIAPGLGFGPLMVMGTEVVLTGRYTLDGFLVSLVPFFLVNNLLLLNQYPDIGADRQAGRNTFAIAFGRRAGARVYALFLALGYVVLIAMVFSARLPAWSLLGLATLLLAVPTTRGVLRYNEDLAVLGRYLGPNVAITLLTPALMAVGMLLGRHGNSPL